MFNRSIPRIWALLALALLAACGSQPIPAGPAPTAAPPPTRTPAAPPTAAAAIAPTPSTPFDPAQGNNSGQGAAASQVPASAPTAGVAQPENPAAAISDSLTPEGYHVLGRLDAPVTLVMYSDFL